MTKADLLEEVSRVVEMTRKESEVIVEAIFDSIVRSHPQLSLLQGLSLRGRYARRRVTGIWHVTAAFLMSVTEYQS